MTTQDAPPAVISEPAFFEQTCDLSYRHALGTTVGAFRARLFP